MSDFLSRLQGYLTTPFKSEMNLTNTVLTTIIVVTVVVIWTRVLRNVT